MSKQLSRERLLDYLRTYDFKERYRVEKRHTKDEEIVKLIIDKGFFTQENINYYAIWDKKYARKIERIINEKLKELKIADRTYLGEKYFLVKLDDVVYNFDRSYYIMLRDIVSGLTYSNSLEDYKYYIATSVKNNNVVLLAETDSLYFGIAQVRGEYLEEERIILSSKLARSQPFFETLVPTYYDWTKLKSPKSKNFEQIVELILQKEANVEKITPIDKTNASDRGRDYDVQEVVSTMKEGQRKKWLVQCKFSSKSISPSTVAGWVERVIEHNYDGYWLITNNDVTPTLFDQFKDVENNPKHEIETRIWQRSDMHIKMNLYNELFVDLQLFHDL